jgi:hypothetical protein
MNTRKRIEVFSAGCSTCKDTIELVKTVADSSHEVVIHDMNLKVWAMQEFKNSGGNHLGMQLLKGRVRFYRRDDDGQLECTGENDINYTPRDETIRLYTGNAFDMTGERSRTEYRTDFNSRWLDESFDIEGSQSQERTCRSAHR